MSTLQHIFKNEVNLSFLENLESLAKTPSTSIIQAIQNEVESVPKDVINRYHAYIIYPLQLHLQNPSLSSDLRQRLVHCIKQVLTKVEIRSAPDFFRLNTLLFMQIHDMTGEKGDKSDELKLEVIECATQLLSSCNVGALEDIYNQSNAGPLSPGVQAAVLLARNEPFIKLRIAALDYLIFISQTHKDSKLTSCKKCQVADVVMLFLPGILGPVKDVICKDDKLNHKVVCKAIECWGNILALVMCDVKEKKKNDLQEILSWKDIKPEEFERINTEHLKIKLQGKERTKEWLMAAAISLKSNIKAVTNCRGDAHPRTKLQLIHTSQHILEQCSKVLNESIIHFFDLLIRLGEDEYSEVSTSAKLVLEEYSIDKLNIGDLLKQKFYDLIRKLRSTVIGQSELDKLSYLQLLTGYVKILGVNNVIQELMLNPAFLDLLLTTMILITQIKSVDVSSMDNTLELTENVSFKTWKHFYFMETLDVIKKHHELCGLLAIHGDTDIMIDKLMEKIHSKVEYENEIILIINEFIKVQMKESALHEEVLTFYLEQKCWEEEDMIEKDAQKAVIKSGLLAEGIGNLAFVMKMHQEVFLLKTLYFLFEKAGSSNSVLQETGTLAVRHVAVACGLNGSVSQLIEQNIDYLTHHIFMKLRRGNDNGVFNVLSFILKYSSMENVHVLLEIVNELVTRSAEHLNSKQSPFYLHLFKTFVISVRHMQNKNQSETKVENLQDFCQQTAADQLEEYIKCKIIADSFEQDAEEFNEQYSQEPVEESDESEKKPRLPTHINMTIAILQQCLHHLPAKNNEKKYLALEILIEGVYILRNYEDELLPIVHKIWSPLVNRFDDSYDLNVNCSFSLLCAMAECSKDFIRSRTLKEVLPVLHQKLISLSCKTKKKKLEILHFKQEYKLQLNIVQNIGKLAVDMKLFEKQLDIVVDFLIPYLSIDQPLPLQESAINSLKIISKYDPYLIWFKLNQQVNEANIQLILINLIQEQEKT